MGGEAGAACCLATGRLVRSVGAAASQLATRWLLSPRPPFERLGQPCGGWYARDGDLRWLMEVS